MVLGLLALAAFQLGLPLEVVLVLFLLALLGDDDDDDTGDELDGG